MHDQHGGSRDNKALNHALERGQNQKFIPKCIKLALRRDNDTISGTVDDFRLGPVTITDPAQQQLHDEPQRFKFYGWQGGLYTIQNAILQDGPL